MEKIQPIEFNTRVRGEFEGISERNKEFTNYDTLKLATHFGEGQQQRKRCLKAIIFGIIPIAVSLACLTMYHDSVTVNVIGSWVVSIATFFAVGGMYINNRKDELTLGPEIRTHLEASTLEYRRLQDEAARFDATIALLPDMVEAGADEQQLYAAHRERRNIIDSQLVALLKKLRRADAVQVFNRLPGAGELAEYRGTADVTTAAHTAVAVRVLEDRVGEDLTEIDAAGEALLALPSSTT